MTSRSSLADAPVRVAHWKVECFVTFPFRSFSRTTNINRLHLIDRASVRRDPESSLSHMPSGTRTKKNTYSGKRICTCRTRTQLLDHPPSDNGNAGSFHNCSRTRCLQSTSPARPKQIQALISLPGR
mmetsp:Transcript_26409/g.60070  ORF Transcript_26409/g.60070 Transcript_26409/m.60070 type:complete len:127 (+) Transcript_26409:3399-3779(+)